MRTGDRAVAKADALRIRWLTIVLVVMAALTVGWPLVNLAVPNQRTLAAGTMLPLGPSRADLAQLTVGRGWSMLQSQSNPRLDYSLRRGAVKLTVSYVAIIDCAPTAQLWSGLRRVIRITDPGVHLGPPSAYMTAQGHRGDQGTLASPAEIGMASVVRSASGTFAVEMVLIGPRHASRANLGAAHLIMQSLHIPAPRR